MAAHPLLSSSALVCWRLRLPPVAAGEGNRVPWLCVASARPAARGGRVRSLSVRCEQGGKGGSGGLDVWLSRGAMLGFVGAVTVELTTGKGLLQNVGLTAPLPTLVLALTAVVGVLTAFLIFQSGTRD
ncbi:stress enhanced protein 1, chloroplastic-like [Miscanthus floridulus]|uniref:stress enhanced protein 1, chloroplastic-like n=1 Tax=Miscanthus floridulus TaxID=154761 RepID=UPI003459274E